MEGHQSSKSLPVEIPNNAISLKIRNMRWKALLAPIAGLAFLLLVTACTNPPPRSATKIINSPEGGTIAYGQVDGQTTEAGAMRSVLQSLQNQYGDRPEVGRVFKVRDTNSFAVFFTLFKKKQGNEKVAGMLIVSRFAPNRIEAGLVSDDAARFGSTVNPMLNRLLSVWQPGGTAPSSDSAAPSSGSAPSSYGSAESTRPAPAAALRQYTLPDRSASVGVPDGWRVDPESSGGTIGLKGPNGEWAGLALTRSAVDPTNQRRRQLYRGGIRDNTSGKIVYPYNVNLAKAFPEILQQYLRLNGQRAAKLQIANAKQVPGARGQRCVHVTGHYEPDGKGMHEMNTLLCATAPSQYGDYMVMFYQTLLPIAVADRERATMGAVMSSFRVNQAVVNKQASAMAAPTVAAINAFGAAALKRGAETSALYDRQNRAWERGQDTKARHNKAFSNYLLDQTVIKDNERNAHGTGWNKTADTLVQSNPRRYEYVNTSDFRKGVDY
jgi:hypothetical protein